MEAPERSADEGKTVLLAQAGDREALARLIDRYDRRLLYFIRRILGEHEGAFDVLQTVWLTVHRKLNSLRSPSAFRIWLFRIAHDHAVGALRKKTRQPVSMEALDLCDDDETLAEPTFDNAEMVHLGLQRLSVDHRRILTLRFLEDMKVDEIAEVLGCATGTVKSRLHYAKLALRRQIEEPQDE
jgi:RNA polymerase sigma-70 factor, ECF subfamily